MTLQAQNETMEGNKFQILATMTEEEVSKFSQKGDKLDNLEITQTPVLR